MGRFIAANLIKPDSLAFVNDLVKQGFTRLL